MIATTLFLQWVVPVDHRLEFCRITPIPQQGSSRYWIFHRCRVTRAVHKIYITVAILVRFPWNQFLIGRREATVVCPTEGIKVQETALLVVHLTGIQIAEVVRAHREAQKWHLGGNLTKFLISIDWKPHNSSPISLKSNQGLQLGEVRGKV